MRVDQLPPRPTELLPWLREQGGNAGRSLRATAGRRLHHLYKQSRGLPYRILGRDPDPAVPDDILADRIKSSIGPLTKRLDIPHVHVSVCGHIASLHGAVSTVHEAREIECAVSQISGVLGVESRLHIGLTPASTRPSEARLHPEFSKARRRLTDSVVRAGVPKEVAAAVWRTVLATLARGIPEDELDQLLCHLPSDVRDAARPPRRIAPRSKRPRSAEALADAVVSVVGLDETTARAGVVAVLHVLKELVPEEAHDVGATLPMELRATWDAA